MPPSQPESSDRPRRFVRQFALTSGRVHPSFDDLPLDAIIRTRRSAARPNHRRAPELCRIVEMCAEPLSVAEISAHLGVHLGIARVLVGDLVASGAVVLTTSESGDDGPNLDTLERLLDDLQSL